MLDINGFRLNVGIVLINSNNQVLLAKRYGQNGWQLPQGGVNDNEKIEQALYRELTEEIGLSKEDVEFIGNTRSLLRYKIPEKMRKKKEEGFIGQKQKWFLLKLIADESKIRFDLNNKPEFDDWQWVSYWYPIRMIINFKRSVYRKALKELSRYIYQEQKYNQLDPIC